MNDIWWHDMPWGLNARLVSSPTFVWINCLLYILCVIVVFCYRDGQRDARAPSYWAWRPLRRWKHRHLCITPSTSWSQFSKVLWLFTINMPHSYMAVRCANHNMMSSKKIRFFDLWRDIQKPRTTWELAAAIGSHQEPDICSDLCITD